jgi:hypothetical protein
MYVLFALTFIIIVALVSLGMALLRASSSDATITSDGEELVRPSCANGAGRVVDL